MDIEIEIINKLEINKEKVNLKNEIYKFNFDYSNKDLKNFEKKLDNIIKEDKMDLDEDHN